MLDRILKLSSDYANALFRLNEAIHSDINSDLLIDAVIQRFEFTFELSWKLMQAYLNFQGIITSSPRQVIKETFKMNLLEDSEAWIDMLMDRHRTAHIYDAQEANIIYNKIISQHAHQLQSFLIQIKKTVQALVADNEQLK